VLSLLDLVCLADIFGKLMLDSPGKYMLSRNTFPQFQVTRDVSLLSRWMAMDLYIREVDSLRFELSMNRCSDSLLTLAQEIIEKGLA